MTAANVLAALRARGVELTVAAGWLRYRAPVGALDNELRHAAAVHRAELLALVGANKADIPGLNRDASGNCAQCRRPFDAKGRCWRCCDRACFLCGRPTGSAFIATCCPCGNACNGNSGEPL